MLSFSNYAKVTIIPPDSEISSYALLFNASKVITFGSTMTIEAVYWKIPVVLMSYCQFNNFRGPIIPEKFEEIISLCFKKDFPKPNKLDVIKIGYYLANYGKKYKFYYATNYLNGYFKGVNLSTGEHLVLPEPKMTTQINKLKRIFYPLYKLFKIFKK